MSRTATAKQRHIPANAEERQFPEADIVVYLYMVNGKHAMMTYKGRRTKPEAVEIFNSEDFRSIHLDSAVKRYTRDNEYKKARQNAEHGLAVGDILVGKWGHEQTNVEFFEVVKVPSQRSATIQKIEHQETHDGASMTGTAVPIPGRFCASERSFNRRTIEKHTLMGNDHIRSFRLWSGEPASFTTYA